MATCTVVLAGPAASQNGHCEFTTSFVPPHPVSGRSCYLKVTNVAAMREQGLNLAQFTTFYVTMDIAQPYSYASINNIIGQPAINDGRLVHRDCRNRVVAVISTGGVGTLDEAAGGFSDQTQCTFPRILVEIPDGPQYVTVGIYKAHGNMSDDIQQLGVVFELTAIDSEEERHLAI